MLIDKLWPKSWVKRAAHFKTVYRSMFRVGKKAIQLEAQRAALVFPGVKIPTAKAWVWTVRYERASGLVDRLGSGFAPTLKQAKIAAEICGVKHLKLLGV